MQLDIDSVKIMLNQTVPESTRSTAQARVSAWLQGSAGQGSILTTTHGIAANYQFVSFSDRTALSSFPEDEKSQKAQANKENRTFSEYFQDKYGIEITYKHAPLIQVWVNWSLV